MSTALRISSSVSNHSISTSRNSKEAWYFDVPRLHPPPRICHERTKLPSKRDNSFAQFKLQSKRSRALAKQLRFERLSQELPRNDWGNRRIIIEQKFSVKVDEWSLSNWSNSKSRGWTEKPKEENEKKFKILWNEEATLTRWIYNV